MKPKTTLILLLAFLVLLSAMLLFDSKSKARQEEKENEKTLVDLAANDIEKVTLKKEDETIAFARDDKGDWRITEPLEAAADSYEVNRMVDDFSILKFDRLVESDGDPSKYEIPRKEVALWPKGKEWPVRILIGMENPLDNSLFAKREDDPRIVLLSSGLKSGLDKKVFDFRQKDIFKFDSDDVAAVKLKAKEIAWKALRKEGQWYLESPVKALAKESRLEDLLRALSGLRAKEFVAEEKQDADLANFGLKDPDFSVSLNLPAANQEIVFSLDKQDDAVYATTSLSSKIVSVEERILTDIEKKVEDIREKQVVLFNSWEASRVEIKRGEFKLSVVKGAEGKWHFGDDDKEEADRSKVEDFIRRVESLEAVEFIDSPADLKAYGLAEPQAEVAIWVKDDEMEKEHTVLVGAREKDGQQVVVKNPALNSLFRVDAAFLDGLPATAEDWRLVPPEKAGAEPDKPGEAPKGDEPAAQPRGADG
ncbi:MAG: DUF4340 domain-containing protein [Candidatus Aminicenantes bacterium]|nr:DUF4340 domain-containing protein [Candidatus Aminicenantes bacterium]